MKKKFAFLFICGGKIVWSGEDEANLLRRHTNEIDRNEVQEFISNAQVGHHMENSFGEFIFRIQ